MIAFLDPLLAGLQALLATIAFGVPTAVLLGARGPLSLLLSPACAALISTLGAALCLAVGVAYGPVMLGLVLVVVLLLLARNQRGGRHNVLSNCDTTLGPAVTASLLIALPASVILLRAPTVWDARSVWFFHSKWILSGGDSFARAISNPAFEFSHSRYPMLAPALGATGWLFGGTGNDWVPMIMTGLLTLSGLALLVRGSLGAISDVPWPLPGVFGVIASVVLLGFGDGTGLDGYLDLTATLFVLAALVLALESRKDLVSKPVLLALWIVAALVKNESLVFLGLGWLALVVLQTSNSKELTRGARRNLPLLLAFLPPILWRVSSSALGADDSPWHLTRALPWSPDFVERTLTIARSVATEWIFMGTLLWLFGAVLARAGLSLTERLAPLDDTNGERYRRQARRLLWLVSLSGIAACFFIYLSTSYELTWHLNSSLDRVILTPTIALFLAGLLSLLETAQMRVAWQKVNC